MLRKSLHLATVLLLSLAACSPATENTSGIDSLTVTVDTAIVRSTEGEGINEESQDVVGGDTTLLNEIKSAFKGPQFNARVAFVYRKAGLRVYKTLDDVGDSTKAADVLAYGTRIVLDGPLVNNQPSDEITVEGFKGRYVSLKNDEGTEMFVFSGYLTNFPLPKEMVGLVDYFTQNFHMVETPVKITSKAMFDGTIPEWEKTKYELELDLAIDVDNYYEGGSTSVTLPLSCTMQEGFLLLRALPYMEAFDSAFYGYPPRGFSKKIDESHQSNVESNDQDGITRISLEDNSGCSDETFVQKVDGRIVIGKGGGC